METTIIKSIRNTIKYWYIPLIVGILFVIMSIVVFTSPVASLLALSILFSMAFIFSGIFESVFAIANRKSVDNWGWTLAFGLITLIAGVLLLVKPALSISVLALFIGFIIVFRSILTIGFAIDIKKFDTNNWWGLLLLGIFGTIVSFILLWNPIFAGLSAVILIALSFLFSGLFNIYLSFQIRKLSKKTKRISERLAKQYDDLMIEIRQEWYE